MGESILRKAERCVKEKQDCELIARLCFHREMKGGGSLSSSTLENRGRRGKILILTSIHLRLDGLPAGKVSGQLKICKKNALGNGPRRLWIEASSFHVSLDTIGRSRKVPQNSNAL